MGQIFFTSDLHFGHANVIGFDKRPFSTVEEMDAELISRWNAKVSTNVLVYVLGDFIWRTRNDDAPTILNSLNGQKHLIKGNHDRFLHNARAVAALASIQDYADIYIPLEDDSVKRCILSHYFIPMYVGSYYGAIHLHGHSHKSKEAAMERRIAEMLMREEIPNRIFNVGCMYWNYAPVTLDEILNGGHQNE